MSDRTHLRRLSPAKQIEQLELALERSERELDSTRKVLQDALEERGLVLPPLFLFVDSNGGYDHGAVGLVIQARNMREAQEYVRRWGERNYPDLGPWDSIGVEELGSAVERLRGGVFAPGIVPGSAF